MEDVSLMRTFIGIGELGKEKGIGSTIIGEDRNTATTEWRPRLEKESMVDTMVAPMEEESSMEEVDTRAVVDTRVMKDVNVRHSVET